MDKDTTWEWRIIVRWLMAQFMVGAAGGAAASRRYTRNSYKKQEWPMKGIFKTVKPAKLEEVQHWLKARIPNCKKTC
jgi:hypothetical protein